MKLLNKIRWNEEILRKNNWNKYDIRQVVGCQMYGCWQPNSSEYKIKLTKEYEAKNNPKLKEINEKLDFHSCYKGYCFASAVLTHIHTYINRNFCLRV